MLDLAHFLIGSAHAQAAAPAAATGGGSTPFGMGLLPFALIFLVFYVLLIRPQQKRLDEQSKMIKALTRGDRIITAGGVHGKIVKFDGDENLIVEIADGVQIKVVRNTVSTLAAKTEPVPKAANTDDPAAKAEKKA